jgi:hypothetical protein
MSNLEVPDPIGGQRSRDGQGGGGNRSGPCWCLSILSVLGLYKRLGICFLGFTCIVYADSFFSFSLVFQAVA